MTVLLAAVACSSNASPTAHDGDGSNGWRSRSQGDFVASFVDADSAVATMVLAAAVDGESAITAFFGEAAVTPVPAPARGHRLRIFASGSALESYWRIRWGSPGFVRQSWMVAAADSSEVQVLSPRVWARDASGHDPSDPQHLREIVIHESVHVYHRRVNTTPNVVSSSDLSWFGEGIAVLASGQLHPSDIEHVRLQLAQGYRPASLAEVLSGPLAYSGAGALVQYIDARFGRAMTERLLHVHSTSELLGLLQLSEDSLIGAWLADTG
ncbi:MAG: hypothetical protein U0132_10000 [Gemmatimonadaceae bacterium]